ncbi:MAG: HNH endonuclease signature motif containing protein [Chloroflexota bacterium]
MSATYISKSLREKIAEQGGRRCGYCLTPESIVGAPMEIDHLIPESLGGPTEEENLWLACPICNLYKSDQIAALDPETGETIRLFNPRLQTWNAHFAWSENGEQIGGITPGGRVTVIALNLNRPTLARARRLWVNAGWWPPTE